MFSGETILILLSARVDPVLKQVQACNVEEAEHIKDHPGDHAPAAASLQPVWLQYGLKTGLGNQKRPASRSFLVTCLIPPVPPGVEGNLEGYGGTRSFPSLPQ